MKDDFSILSQFLDSLGPEVSGRSSSPLTDEQANLIRLFAAGDLGEEARDTLLPELLGNETALRELVSHLQAR